MSWHAREGRHDVGAIVMGADYRGLGVTRSLGRSGIPVWVLRHDDQILGALSRYARRSLAWPGDNGEDRLSFLLALARQHALDGWVLFPTDDETVLLVARHHALLARRFRLTTPPWDDLRSAVDKRLLYDLAQQSGVDCPRTHWVRDRDELLTLDCPFPSILKPAFREGPNRLTTAKAWRVDDRPTLLARFDEAAALVPPETILIQELIPGGPEGQFSYAALCVDAQPRASVTARRVRQFPMDLGRASTYVETVDETDVVKPSLRLLEALRFSGLVEIEYKRDPRDGRCKLLDVNPRVWGWHSVCRRAGVDFPLLVWRQALGRAVPELCGSTGVRWVRITTDLSASMREIARGRMSLRTYLASLRRPIESAIFAWDDPWPGLLEVPSMTYLFGKRLLRGEDL